MKEVPITYVEKVYEIDGHKYIEYSSDDSLDFELRKTKELYWNHYLRWEEIREFIN